MHLVSIRYCDCWTHRAVSLGRSWFGGHRDQLNSNLSDGKHQLNRKNRPPFTIPCASRRSVLCLFSKPHKVTAPNFLEQRKFPRRIGAIDYFTDHILCSEPLFKQHMEPVWLHCGGFPCRVSRLVGQALTRRLLLFLANRKPRDLRRRKSVRPGSFSP